VLSVGDAHSMLCDGEAQYSGDVGESTSGERGSMHVFRRKRLLMKERL